MSLMLAVTLSSVNMNFEMKWGAAHPQRAMTAIPISVWHVDTLSVSQRRQAADGSAPGPQPPPWEKYLSAGSEDPGWTRVYTGTSEAPLEPYKHSQHVQVLKYDGKTFTGQQVLPEKMTVK